MKIKAFIMPHKAESMSDCEDRFAINYEDRIAAVSDGVSQSIFQAEWAEMLVTHYIKNGNYTNEDRINTLCPKWYKHVNEYLQKHDDWMLESMIAEGKSAGATLCGIKFTNKNHWQCDVLGDSCLVVIENNEIKKLLSSETKAFDNYPDYIDSNPRHSGRGEIKRYEGDLTSSSCLLLVTDAFSDFFFQLGEKSNSYITQLLSVNSHEEYKGLVEKWRAEGMHDDDSTVVVIEWDGDDKFTKGYIDSIKDMVAKDKISDSDDTSNNYGYDSLDEVFTSASTNDDQSQFDTTPICNPNQEPTTQNDASVCDVNNPQEINYDNLKELVPEFIEVYMNNIKVSSKTGFTSLISYVFQPKKHRVKALEKLLQDALMSFIDFYSKQDR